LNLVGTHSHTIVSPRLMLLFLT